MLQTVHAVVHGGRIEVSEAIELPEGSKLLVTVLPAEEDPFWLAASIWNNAQDDVYAELLKK